MNKIVYLTHRGLPKKSCHKADYKKCKIYDYEGNGKWKEHDPNDEYLNWARLITGQATGYYSISEEDAKKLMEKLDT